MASSHASFVGSVPEMYDRHMGPLFFTPYAADLVQRLDVSQRPVLEIASGTGRLTAQLVAHLGAPVVALDLNAGMQRIAADRLADPRARWVTGNAMALPFPDRAFGQAVCQFGVMFFPDKARAAAEVRRVLKPGGTFLFNVWASLDRNALTQIAERVAASFFPDNPPTFYQVPFGYFDPDRIRGDLRTAGFASADISVVDLQGPCESARSAAIGLVQGTPLASVIRERGTVSHAAITDALAHEFEQRYGDGPFETPMRALVVRAAA